MNLADILEQLETLRARLAEVDKSQHRIDKEAEKIANKYKISSKHLKLLQTTFSKLLPETVQNSLRKVNEHLQTGIKLNSKNVKLQKDYREALDKSVSAWAQLQAFMEKGRDPMVSTLSEWVKKKDLLSAAAHTAEKAATKIEREQLATQGHLTVMNQKMQSFTSLLSAGHSTLTTIAQDLAVISSILGFTSLMKSYFLINKLLIEANSAWENRLKIVKANYAVSLQLGASTERVALAQRALAAHGQKALAADTKRISTIVKLYHGLGLAEDETAQMALDADLTGNSFQKAADAVALLVNRTNLTSREALKLSSTILKVQRTLGLTTKSMPEIATSMGAVEGALKGMGGSEGMVGRLIEHFSTLKGVGDSIMFGGKAGILNPEDFKDAEKLTSMLKHTGERLRELTGGDPLRLAAFEPMLQRMGLTMLDARALMQMSKPEEFAKIARNIKEANKTREETSALEKRFREQQAETGQQWEQLKEIGSALVKQALIPLLQVATTMLQGLNVLLSKLSEFSKWIAESDSGWATSLAAVGKAISYVASFVVGGIMLRSIFVVGRALLGFGGGIATVGTALRFFLTRLLLPISALIGAIKTIEAMVQSYKLFKDIRTEKSSASALASQQADVRSRYGIEGDHDTAAWLRLQNEQRWKAESSSTPYQPQVMQNTPRVQIAAPAPGQTGADGQFQALTQGIKSLQATVKTGNDQQNKMAEKSMRIDISRDRLVRENDALRTSPATTYGLELYR